MILIFADLKSPLMFDRIEMLRGLDEIILVHNADGIKLSKEVLNKYQDYKIIEQPRIKNRTLRYILSALFTLYLILRYNPKLIVVHWASRLYQNLVFALFGNRCIVHTMGGDINREEDCHGKKKYYTNIFFKHAKFISVKSDVMKKILLDEFKNIDSKKIVELSWGVDFRFFDCNKNKDEKYQFRMKHFGKAYKKLLFCIRSFKPIHHKMEILKIFIELFKNSSDIALISSVYDADRAYLDRCIKELELNLISNIYLLDIKHEEMHKFICGADAIISWKVCDGVSQSIMEAVASKTWVITFDILNHRDLIVDGVNGSLFLDENGLKESIKAVCFQDKTAKTPLNIINSLDRNIQKDRYIELCRRIIHG